MIHITSGDISMHERVTGTTVLQFMGAIRKAMDDAGTGQYKEFKLMAELDAMGIEMRAKEMPSCRGVGTDSVRDLGQEIIDGRGVTA